MIEININSGMGKLSKKLFVIMYLIIFNEATVFNPLFNNFRHKNNILDHYINSNKMHLERAKRSTHVGSLTSVIKYNTHPGVLVSRILTRSFLNCNHSFPWLAPSYLKFNIKIYSLLLNKYQVES